MSGGTNSMGMPFIITANANLVPPTLVQYPTRFSVVLASTGSTRVPSLSWQRPAAAVPANLRSVPLRPATDSEPVNAGPAGRLAMSLSSATICAGEVRSWRVSPEPVRIEGVSPKALRIVFRITLAPPARVPRSVTRAPSRRSIASAP